MASPSDASMSINVDSMGNAESNPKMSSTPSVPWQIWVVVILLGLEGVGNLFAIPDQPAALYWLAGKCLFIVGLLKRWLWVYCLFLAFAVIHVIFFLPTLPIASLMNAILIALALSARRFYVAAD